MIYMYTKSDYRDCSDVDKLAKKIFDFYTKKLKENNYRIFAKNVDFNKRKVDFYELSAFKSVFSDHFKTLAQVRKTKHIKTDFLRLDLFDFFDNPYSVFFVVDKKEYDKRGIDYLNDVFNKFVAETENKIKKL